MMNVKFKRAIIIFTSGVFILMLLIILFISPVAKYLIEKNCEKWVGRQVKMSWIFVNPFTGSAHIKNLKIFEQQGDSVFLSADGFNISFNVLKMFHRTYEISELSLNKPVIWVIQDKKEMNFGDLITKFSSNKNPLDTLKRHHLNLLRITIKDGEFHYIEKSIPVNYYIKKVNIESPGKMWNVDTIAFRFSFISGTSTGEISGNSSVNVSNLNYRLAVDVKKFDLQIIQQYLKDLVNYGSFSANLDASIVSAGNLKDNEKVNSSGMIALNDFHLGKSAGDDYVSFSKLILAIRKMNPKGFEYNYDSIILIKPYFKYERYDYLDNLQRMFGKGGEGIKTMNAQRSVRFNLIIEIANYIKVISRNFFRSNYKIGKLAIYDGNFKFNDFSLNEKFSVAANPFSIRIDSVSKQRKRVEMFLKTSISPFGNLSVNLSINPKDTGEFDLVYHLNKLPLAIFNPYIITYTSYPVDRGTIELNGKWSVRNGNIQSANHLLIIDPRLAVRLKRKDAKRLPVPLILAFIRERDNYIDYEIPVTGDLKDPKFNLWNVVFDMLGNILIKPPSIPYIAHVKHVENEIEKFLTVVWKTRQVSIYQRQKDFLEKMNDFLKDNPAASISVTPVEFEDKEKEYILFYEAKKKYYLLSHKPDRNSFTEEDSLIVDKMAVKDSLFVHFMNKQVPDTMMFTIQEKCTAFLGKTANEEIGNYTIAGRKIVDAQFSRLVKERETLFRSFFQENDIWKRIKFQKEESGVPYNGFSFYRIDYKGDIPKNLRRAYEQMNELVDRNR